MWSGLGAALVGGGLSVGGSLLGGLLNAEYAGEAADLAWVRQLEAARIAFERQKELMQLQMDYNTDMSSSAHQRQVLDMKLAGLNPILSANLGGASYSGVSAPSVSTGSAPQASSVDFGDLGFGRAGDLIGKSSAMRLAGEQAKEIKANSISQRALNDANASSARANAELMKKQTEKVELEKDLVKAQTDAAGKRNISELPFEALKYIDERLLNSGKTVNNNSYYFYKEMRDLGRDIKNDLDANGRFNISPKRIFERFGKNPPESSLLRSGFGY